MAKVSPCTTSIGLIEAELNGQYRPVDEPVAKSWATIQTSGEAVYADGIPSPTNCLHGAFIYEAKPLAWVDDTKLSPQITGSAHGEQGEKGKIFHGFRWEEKELVSTGL